MAPTPFPPPCEPLPSSSAPPSSPPTGSVAVVGCGPVGLLAVLAARARGAAAVFAVDAVPSRATRAAAFGASPLAPPAARAALRAATGGRGADIVLEAVGAPGALSLAFELARPAGTVSSVGVQVADAFPFSPVDCYDKNITLRWGRGRG
jgi:threonine dehydrogenase-like Zn-dependent dehydrogenase